MFFLMSAVGCGGFHLWECGMRIRIICILLDVMIIWVESVIRPFLGRKKAFLPEAAAAFGYLFIYLQTLSE